MLLPVLITIRKTEELGMMGTNYPEYEFHHLPFGRMSHKSNPF
jgi:hypothetical protein